MYTNETDKTIAKRRIQKTKGNGIKWNMYYVIYTIHNASRHQLILTEVKTNNNIEI